MLIIAFADRMCFYNHLGNATEYKKPQLFSWGFLALKDERAISIFCGAICSQQIFFLQ